MIKVPSHILSALDRISLKNEIEQEFIINSMTPGEPRVFNVVVVSGESETNNANEGTAYGNKKRNNNQEPSYYFVRVRRENVDSLEKPDPFLATNSKMAKKLANMHPIGCLLSNTATRSPLPGEIWSARYLTKDRRGIILKERVGVSKKFLSLQKKDSIYQSQASSWGQESPVLLSSYGQVQEGSSSESIPYKPSGSKITAEKLYADLMGKLNNHNLVIAMVANAIAESALYPNNNGDCGSYAKNKGIDTSKYPHIFHKPSRKNCCSFGLWQYNICGGLGIRLLKAYGEDKNSSDEAKYRILTDYKKQVDFMISHVQKKFDTTDPKNIDDWVHIFVYQVERPKYKKEETEHRQKIARGLKLP